LPATAAAPFEWRRHASGRLSLSANMVFIHQQTITDNIKT